jgi:hypothetical protein
MRRGSRNRDFCAPSRRQPWHVGAKNKTPTGAATHSLHCLGRPSLGERMSKPRSGWPLVGLEPLERAPRQAARRYRPLSFSILASRRSISGSLSDMRIFALDRTLRDRPASCRTLKDRRRPCRPFELRAAPIAHGRSGRLGNLNEDQLRAQAAVEDCVAAKRVPETP